MKQVRFRTCLNLLSLFLEGRARACPMGKSEVNSGYGGIGILREFR
jgi:hypothetical protein